MAKENHIEEFNRLMKEVNSALKEFRKSSNYQVETRMNIVAKGLEEGLKHMAIIKAFAILFSDYTIIRISTRMMYKKILAYLKTT